MGNRVCIEWWDATHERWERVTEFMPSAIVAYRLQSLNESNLTHRYRVREEDGGRPCSPPTRGRTIREAICVALEGLPGRAREWTAADDQLSAVRQHVILWVGDYARHRGVVLSERDVIDELDAVIAELRGSA